MSRKRTHSDSLNNFSKSTHKCICNYGFESCERDDINNFPSPFDCKNFKSLLSEINISSKQLLILICNYLKSIQFDEEADSLARKCKLDLTGSHLSKIIYLISNKDFETLFKNIETLIPHEEAETYFEIKKEIFLYLFRQELEKGSQVEALKFLLKFSGIAGLTSKQAYIFMT
ncbi:hypothetical protein RF11_12916 [Thelohanellus kitauei]|uniref:Uncharacterized protein n=1 Tax=Thelohanellus kitauei TaxID=669202 RepID=A0A0C2M378_THEKT|nr:hypothetical protein RF11_12916 [Thelohanellus kitauei]